MTDFSDWRAANSIPPTLQFASFAVGASVVLGVIGPFGTMPAMAAPARLAHWVLSGCTIGLLMLGGMAVVRRLWPSGSRSLWITLLVAAAAAVPGAWIVEACLWIWSPASLADVRWRQLFAQCLFLNVVLTLLGMRLLRRAGRRLAADIRAAPPSGAAFVEWLPAPLQSARLLALSAEDHYLRVHTDRGQALIHMRISDAEALLRGGDGLRVHRSHWVSRAAMRHAAGEGGRWRLELENGMSVPVGRSRISVLTQAGWLRTRREGAACGR